MHLGLKFKDSGLGFKASGVADIEVLYLIEARKISIGSGSRGGGSSSSSSSSGSSRSRSLRVF